MNSSARPTGLVFLQVLGELREVTLEPRQLFGNVRTIGEDRDLLEQAFVFERDLEAGFADPLVQRGAVLRHDFREQRADFADGLANCS
jgi:hypothetical protein